jgi:catecholate siderophore receptor
MSDNHAARIPGSLRALRTSAPPAATTKPDVRAATVLTAACLVAAPLQGAFAQQSPGAGVTPLPPVTVDAQPSQKKRAPKAAPQPTPAAQAVQTPEQKSANPYANPDAPYKVETSGSTKITEPLVNTPKTVTTIPKEVIRDTAATSIRDLARQTPGVVLGFAEGGNAFGDSIYIRGFNARNDIYVDGLRDPGNSSRETFAVEQIEVYKGPGSAVSGRGTPGGALNIITKKPREDRNFYNLSTTFGTDGQKRVTADVNQVLNPGVAVRGNVMYHDSDVAGRDFTHDERWGGQFAITVKPSSDFKFTVDYYRYRTQGIPDFGVPINTSTKVPWTESGVSRSTWYGIALRDFIKNDVDTITGTAEWKVAPGVVITSKTRYGEVGSGYVASNAGAVAGNVSTVTTGNPQRLQETMMVGNQTDMTMKFVTGDWKHTLVTGVELSSEKISRYTFSGITTSPGVSLFAPDAYRSFAPVGPPSFSYRANIDTKSAYVLDTVKLSEKWIINGGVRVDNYNRSQEAAAAVNNASREDTLVNWHAGIVYKPIPIASFYAAYATASSPSGGELDSTGVTYGGLTAATALLNPEQTTGVEVGTKWELFDKKLLASVALFQTEKTNARENTTTCTTVAPFTCTAADTAAYRVRGVEFGAQGNIDKYWSVYGGMVFLETEVTQSAFASNLGRRLANIPLQQFTLLSKYQVTDALSVGGQATYSGEVFNGFFAAADQGYHIPAHWRFDLLSEYKFDKNFAVQLNVLNVTNELYYDALYQSAGSFAFVAPGRAGYLTLSWKY